MKENIMVWRILPGGLRVKVSTENDRGTMKQVSQIEQSFPEMPQHVSSTIYVRTQDRFGLFTRAIKVKR